MGSSCLLEVVVHGGSTVQISWCWKISVELLKKQVISGKLF